VLYLEMLLGGRRGRQMVFRYIYAGWLVVQLAFLWIVYYLDYQARTRWIGNAFVPDPNATSRFATNFVELFVVQQLVLTLLITPAFAAGAITDEKTRGTLQYMLTAHLTAGEIILGKLLARMAQVGLLIITGLPVLCFIGVFGGLHPLMMIVVFAVTVAPVFALAAASLLASVWARQTRDAVLSLYAVGAGLLLLAWISRGVAAAMTLGLPIGATPGVLLTLLTSLNALTNYFNPIFVLQPGWETGNALQLLQRLLGSVVVYSGVGMVCVGLAVWRLRASYLKQLESSGKRQAAEATTAAARPALGDDPIRWKEREVEGIAPLATLRRIPLTAGIVLVFLITVISSLILLWLSMPATATLGQVFRRLARFDLAGLASTINSATAGTRFLVQAIVAMFVASLVVGIRCSGTVSGERERQTWEALLLTPLEAKQLIRGKLWGIMGAALPCLAAYAIPAMLLSLFAGFQAFFWTVLWLAVTLLAMWYVGAAGICCSVSSRSSWRALLGTVGFGYLGGIVLYGCTQPIVWIIAGIIYIFLKLIDELYDLKLTQAVGLFKEFFFAFFIASCLTLAAIFYGVAWWFIAHAEKRVADRERTRHWKDEPIFRPRRRSATTAPMRYYP
jgi:ABC-type transport system involved in multi-copper enzyme maturation permease subunit